MYSWIKNKYKYIHHKKAAQVIELGNNSLINFVKGAYINNVYIEDNAEINSFGGKLSYMSVGRNTYLYGNLQIYGFKGKLVIGRFCSIAGPLVIICGEGYHKNNRISTYPFPFKMPFKKNMSIENYYDEYSFPKCEVVIGNDVWVGEDVLITQGVKVGNGAVIAAKSVVTKNVPPYAIVAGNPAQVKKTRFDDRFISILEKIRWWDWSIEKIEENYKIFTLTDEYLFDELEKL
jgi:virginiamycin A acetyltransferase